MFGSAQKGCVIERLFCCGLMGRENAVLLLSTDLHEDKGSKLQIIHLFLIQIVETNSISLEIWGRENVLSNYVMKRRKEIREKKSWPIFYMNLNPRKPQAIKGLSSCGSDLPCEK